MTARVRWADKMSGQVVNGVLILGSAEINTHAFVECPRCKKRVVVSVYKLKRGIWKTCAACYGLIRKENSNGEVERGRVFGSLKIVGQSKRKGHCLVECLKCGKQYESRYRTLIKGEVTQCSECRSKEDYVTHIEGVDPELALKIEHLYFWVKRRCDGKECKKTASYRRRGIGIYPLWDIDKKAFIIYVSSLLHAGDRGYQLDRIDNDRGYEPGNLRFVLPKENARNRCDNTVLVYKGETMCHAEFIERFCVGGYSDGMIRKFLVKDGLSPEEVIEKDKQRYDLINN